ncbi:MAG: 16S rRNA (adenine(1518)-N(6)/adenine(1519)-N(6))-dimethyltransferase RsmA [Bacteroidales bacterium]|nr:16S rRNA (adenine(1518)-N(6)/adenine(1519)-N(6))-dimethyltransferase RsmA [Bacteroidales bacterium]
MSVTPKKRLGQHFLTDENIAGKIVGSLLRKEKVLEIGPGTGVLTKYLIKDVDHLMLIEIDGESVEYLREIYPELENRIIHADFLKSDISGLFKDQFSIIGNFPYNISSQIFFRIIENRHLIPEAVGMIQKEVAERLASPPGNKTYGILSVILGAFYDIKYLFTVSENVFHPPPKVKSAVIRLTRKENFNLDCDEQRFVKVVKTGFNQRRKTLRNSLKSMLPENTDTTLEIFSKRPEQLDLAGFIEITKLISPQ